MVAKWVIELAISKNNSTLRRS